MVTSMAIFSLYMYKWVKYKLHKEFYMWYSGKKPRKEEGKTKPWDQYTEYALSMTYVFSSRQCQNNFFLGLFCEATYTRGVFKYLLLTSQTIEPFSFPQHHGMMDFWRVISNTARQPGKLRWGSGLCLQCLSWIWGHIAFRDTPPEMYVSHLPRLSIMGTNLSKESSSQNIICRDWRPNKEKWTQRSDCDLLNI